MAEKYTPYPSVAPEFKATPKIEEKFPEVPLSNAVGEALKYVGEGMGTLGKSYAAVGESYGKLGRSVEGAGDELFRRAEALKNLEIDKEVDQATLKNYQVQGENADKFLTLQGDQASPETLKAHMKMAEDSRQAIEDTLRSEEAKRRYRAQSRGTMGNEARRMSSYAAGQQKIAVTGATTASVEMYKDQAGKADNDVDFNDALNRGKGLINDKLRHLKGWRDEQTQQEINRFQSEAIANRVILMSDKDPTAAMNYLEANKDKITSPGAYEKVYESVKRDQYRVESRNIGDRANENPEATREERLEKADKEAEAVRPGDKELRDAARQRTIAVFDQEQRDKKDVSDRNKQTVTDAVFGNRDPDGKLPTKPEDLQVWPDVKAAYDGLSPVEKRKMDTLLAHNAKEDYPMTPATQSRRDQLMGESMNDPYTFKDRDLAAEHIPWSDRKELRKVQERIIKEGVKAAEDPKVKRALSIMIHGGILPVDLMKTSEQKNQFMGMLRQALIEAEQEPGRTGPLKEQEVMNVGKTILKTLPGTGLFGTNVGASTLWEKMKEDIPSAVIEAYKRADPTATDEQITEHYARRRFKEEYDKLYGTTRR